MRLRLRLAAVALAAASLTGLGVTEASAGPAPHVWSTYYENRFSSRESCRARGRQMLGIPPYYTDRVPGIDRIKCYRVKGWPKWSMDVRWYGEYAL